MKLIFCFLPWFFLLVHCDQPANVPRAFNSHPAPSKAVYTIIPKDGTDTSETASYIKDIIGAVDLQPWTDVNEKIMSWTVEATMEEVAQLKEYDGINQIDKLEIPAQSRVEARQDDAKTNDDQDSYIIWPVDGRNRQQTDAIDASLRGFLQDRVRKPRIYDEEVHYWVAQMNSAEVDRASGIDGVDAVEENGLFEPGFTIPKAPEPSEASKLSGSINKRDISYATQKNAVTELVAISQPSSIPKIDNLKHYVYESRSGDDTWVYHIEKGVSLKDQSAEFPNVVPDDEHLQTEIANAIGMKPWNDDTTDSHGTCTAGKAVGKRFGVSKKSKLVVVQVYEPRVDQILEALDLVADDVKAKAERRKKSVITMSLGNSRGMSRKSVMDFRRSIQNLFNLDVPYVISSGNQAETDGRGNVDCYPALLEGPDMPIIVVGSVNSKGEKSAFSQSGPHVVVHAVGDRADCLPKSGSDPVHVQGTSLSVPQVAGEIANLLGYETVPFDTSDSNLVKNLRDYLKSDSGSWERTRGVRTLWNGVKKENNPETADQKKPKEPPLPKEEVKCHGLDKNKYVGRDAVKDVIEKEFCPDAVKQGALDKDSGSIRRKYNEGTLEAVSISMHWQPGLDFKPKQDDCVKFLMAAVDGCDGKKDGNPENYKGGGTTADWKILYRVDPMSERQPASKGKQADCHSDFNVFFNEYVVWGRGFSTGDYGKSLKKEIKGCALLPGTWSFGYGLEDDGREWRAKFRTGIFQKNCVGNAVGTAGAIADFGCSGTG